MRKVVESASDDYNDISIFFHFRGVHPMQVVRMGGGSPAGTAQRISAQRDGWATHEVLPG